MELEENDPASAFTCQIVDDNGDEDEDDGGGGGVGAGLAFSSRSLPPLVEYFDEKGNNVTPLPLHTLDDQDQQQLGRDPLRRRRYPPHKNPIMRTFLHVTTALYSMAGLGSLETSKAFKAIKKELDEEEEEEEKRTKKATLSGRLKARQKADQHKVDTEVEEMDAASWKRRKDYLPDSMRVKTAKEIDILLVETDTIWMLELPGTCVEFDPDKKEEDGKKEEEEQKKTKEEDPNVSGYELVESWTQTLDFSKKKKGTQCDDIVTDESSTQVSTKNFLDEERKQQQLMESPGPKSPRSPLPKPI